MSRLELVPSDTQHPDIAPLFHRLKERWGAVLNLYRTLAWAPALTKAWGMFAWSLRFEVGVLRRTRELLIIRIAQALGAEYEYVHHVHMAEDEGITADQVNALPNWHASNLFDPSDRLILTLADELALGTGAAATTMQSLIRAYGEKETVELVVTGSFYCGVARVINSFQVDLEDGHEHLRPKAD
jgi:alkylhydroperoxidase family enzyme